MSNLAELLLLDTSIAAAGDYMTLYNTVLPLPPLTAPNKQ